MVYCLNICFDYCLALRFMLGLDLWVWIENISFILFSCSSFHAVFLCLDMCIISAERECLTASGCLHSVQFLISHLTRIWFSDSNFQLKNSSKLVLCSGKKTSLLIFPSRSCSPHCCLPQPCLSCLSNCQQNMPETYWYKCYKSNYMSKYAEINNHLLIY